MVVRPVHVELLHARATKTRTENSNPHRLCKKGFEASAENIRKGITVCVRKAARSDDACGCKNAAARVAYYWRLPFRELSARSRVSSATRSPSSGGMMSAPADNR